MAIINNDEPDPFLQKREWKAYQESRRKIEESSPEYKKQQKKMDTLSRLVSFMIYPDGPYRCAEIRRESTGRLIRLDASGRRNLLGRPQDEQLQPGCYPVNADYHLYIALRKYCTEFRKQPESILEERNNLFDVDLISQNLIGEASLLARWPYRLGASLYLHQQMVVRNKCTEPSQGKAQWLVAKAPVKPTRIANAIPLRPDGGEPSKIGDQWKKYYSVAHFWAAFVVWAKSPLDVPDDKFVLLDFIRTAEVDEFLANAALFREFRANLKATRTKRVPLINQFGERDDMALEGVMPNSERSVPDLLDDYQWAALKAYKTRPRRNRSTPSQ